MRALHKLAFALLFSTAYAEAKSEPDSLAKHPKGTPMPVELMVGHNWAQVQAFVVKDFETIDRLKLASFFAYEFFYDGAEPVYFVQSVAAYQLGKRFEVRAGAHLKSKFGFRPVVGTRWASFGPKLTWIIQPTIELHGNGASELFGFIQVNPTLGKKRFLLSAFLLSSVFHNQTQHDITFMNVRAGIWLNKLSVGPAFNSSFKGQAFSASLNVGAFASYLLF